jgi:hypothetical protein
LIATALHFMPSAIPILHQSSAKLAQLSQLKLVQGMYGSAKAKTATPDQVLIATDSN